MFLFNCSSVLIKEKKTRKQREIYRIYADFISDDWEKRSNAIKRIDNHLDGSSRKILMKILIRALDDKHDIVKIEALTILGKRVPPSAFNKINIMSRHEASNVRWYSLKSLSNYKNKKAFNSFGKSIHSSDWLIREQAIIGLLKIKGINKNKRSIPYIIIALRDKKRSVKIAALNYIRIKDKRIYKQIRRIFIKAKKNNRITLIIASLRAINGYKIDEKVKKHAISLLSHNNYNIKLLALSTLKANEKILEEELER